MLILFLRVDRATLPALINLVSVLAHVYAMHRTAGAVRNIPFVIHSVFLSEQM
jgi:hypothetical protein